MKINNRGNETSRIWIVVEAPYSTDFAKGYLYSSPLGWHFDKILKESGIDYWDTFITCLKPDPDLAYDNDIAVQDFVSFIDRHRPPFILTLGEGATGLLLPQTRSFKKPFKSRVESFAGSLLRSPHINYDHYAICSHPPDHIMSDWKYRDIQIFLDFGRLRNEYDYWKTNGHLQPLPDTEYDITINPAAEKLIELMLEMQAAPRLSMDIETIRPSKQSVEFEKNPGFPYLIGIADSGKRGVSFSLWNYGDSELVVIWRTLDTMLSNSKTIIGQNFFNFDSHYLHAIGYGIGDNLAAISDIMIRQHVLWPELEKSLQFQTKQYTRQPYYKDEGKGFIPRNKRAMDKYMYYNALDCVVTYQVWEAQELELVDRPTLI